MRRSTPVRAAAHCLIALAAALVLGCTTRQVIPQPVPSAAATPGIAPQLVVEQFLRAVNCVSNKQCTEQAQQLDAMGRLFGTADGPVIERDTRANVEQRMVDLASLLHHDDYAIEGQSPVPGRVGVAVRLMVKLTIGDRTPVLPFTMVHAKSGKWLVEKIDLDPLMHG